MEIKVFANFREICGAKVVDIAVVEGQTIGILLDELILRFPAMKDELFTPEKQLKPMIHVFINGKNIIHLQGLSTTLKTTDQIALFPPVAGG